MWISIPNPGGGLHLVFVPEDFGKELKHFHTPWGFVRALRAHYEKMSKKK